MSEPSIYALIRAENRMASMVMQHSGTEAEDDFHLAGQIINAQIERQQRKVANDE